MKQLQIQNLYLWIKILKKEKNIFWYLKKNSPNWLINWEIPLFIWYLKKILLLDRKIPLFILAF